MDAGGPRLHQRDLRRRRKGPGGVAVVPGRHGTVRGCAGRVRTDRRRDGDGQGWRDQSDRGLQARFRGTGSGSEGGGSDAASAEGSCARPRGEAPTGAAAGSGEEKGMWGQRGHVRSGWRLPAVLGPPLRHRVHITCAGRTDVGIIRSGNEDNFLMVPDKGVFIVADGMGGHAAGEVASEMAVRVIAREVGSLQGLNDEQVAERMRLSIRAANGAIFERTLTEHDKRGMGTTVTALTLFANRFLIGQVGDSRAYLLRDGKLAQVTKDHSYVQEQVDAGYLTPEQARTHPYANVITRCVGASADVMPDIFSGTVRPGDVFLLASDGLTGILQAQGNPEKWVDKLVAEANRRGGLDNITCIIVHVDEIDTVATEITTTGEAPATR